MQVTTYIASKIAMKHFRIASKGFRRGFAEGFAAHAEFFAEASFPRTNAIDTSIGAAWQEVGDALKSAEKREHVGIGKRAK